MAVRRDGLFDFPRGDALEAAVHGNDAHRTVESPGERGQCPGQHREQRGTAAVFAPLGHECRPLPRRLLRLRLVLEPIAAHETVPVHLRALEILRCRTICAGLMVCAPSKNWSRARATPALRSRYRIGAPPSGPGCGRSCPESC